MPAYNLMILNPETNEFELSTDYGSVPHFRVDPDGHKWTVGDIYDHRTYKYHTEATAKMVVWADPLWRDREASRFKRGIYSALPWDDLEPIADHFAHVSIDDGAKIAFTEDETKGQVDRQTRIKPGRYLKKFYPHLTSDEIREKAALVDKATQVRYAVTPEDIERVYTNGPHSCMAYSMENSEFESRVHPVTVYGNSDLQLAYLSSVDITHDDFRASSRALVWPAKKVYVRIYGDETRMRPALEAEGYSYGDFQGAKIGRVMHDDGVYVVPYLDCGHFATDRGDHLKIDRHGDVNCETTTGLTEDNRNFCEFYDRYTTDEVHYVRDVGQRYSETAIENGHATRCDGSGNYYSDRMSFHEINGLTYSEEYLEDYGFHCERSERWFLSRRETQVTLQDTDETVALSWARAALMETDDEGVAEVWHDETTDKWFAVKPSDETLAEMARQLRLDLEAASTVFTMGDGVRGEGQGGKYTGTIVSGPDGDGDYLIQLDPGHDRRAGFPQGGIQNCWYLRKGTVRLLEADPVATPSVQIPPQAGGGFNPGDLVVSECGDQGTYHAPHSGGHIIITENRGGAFEARTGVPGAWWTCSPLRNLNARLAA